MKRWLLLLFVTCAIVAARVPRDKQSLPENESKQNICESTTPCAWSIYSPSVKVIQMNITNNYCTCGVGTSCLLKEDDPSINSYVYHCIKEKSSPISES